MTAGSPSAPPPPVSPFADGDTRRLRPIGNGNSSTVYPRLLSALPGERGRVSAPSASRRVSAPSASSVSAPRQTSIPQHPSAMQPSVERRTPNVLAGGPLQPSSSDSVSPFRIPSRGRCAHLGLAQPDFSCPPNQPSSCCALLSPRELLLVERDEERLPFFPNFYGRRETVPLL